MEVAVIAVVVCVCVVCVCVCFVVCFFSGTGELCAFVCLSTSDGECA